MSLPKHIEEFLTELVIADEEIRAEGAAKVKELCTKLNISVIWDGSRFGPEAYYFILSFSGDVQPKEVFVKSIYHHQNLSQIYNLLTSLFNADGLMHIYGATNCWAVYSNIPTEQVLSVNKELDMKHR